VTESENQWYIAGTFCRVCICGYLQAIVHCCPFASWHAWSRDHTNSSVTAVLLPLGQRCGTVCLNSFSIQTSPSDSSNDHWKRLCLVSWATAPCVWMLRVLTRNLLTYLLTYEMCVLTTCPEYLHLSGIGSSQTHDLLIMKPMY